MLTFVANQNSRNMETIIDDGKFSSNPTPHPAPQVTLPNSGGILALGILSIVFAGSVGLILGIIGMSMAGPALRNYAENPGKYTESSLKNAKAGKVCSIIGTSLAGAVLLILLFALLVNM